MFRSNLQPDVRGRDGGGRGRRVSLGRSPHWQLHHRPGAHRRRCRLLPPAVYHQAPDLPGKNCRFKYRYVPFNLVLVLVKPFIYYTLIYDLFFPPLFIIYCNKK